MATSVHSSFDRIVSTGFIVLAFNAKPKRFAQACYITYLLNSSIFKNQIAFSLCFIWLGYGTSLDILRYPNFSNYDSFPFNQIYTMMNMSKLKFSSLTVIILSFPITLFPDWTVTRSSMISSCYPTKGKFLLCFIYD